MQQARKEPYKSKETAMKYLMHSLYFTVEAGIIAVRPSKNQPVVVVLGTALSTACPINGPDSAGTHLSVGAISDASLSAECVASACAVRSVSASDSVTRSSPTP